MNQDRVKRWTDSVRYYKLVRLKKGNELSYIEAHSIRGNGYNFFPKKKVNDSVINVSKVTIISPVLLKRLIEKRDKRKQKLDDTYNSKIKTYETIKEEDKKRNDIVRKIAELKKELMELKQKEDEEYDKEVRRSR